MSHCVPDWDGNGGELDAIIPSTDFLPPVKGKWESLPQKRKDYDAPETYWTDNGHIVMQGQGNKGNRPQWQQVNYNNWSGGQDSEDAVTPLKPANSPTGKDGGLVMNDPVETPVHTNSIQDDEMVSWLQYPLDDSLERNYCSDFFGELPNSNMSNIQLLKESVAAGQMSAARLSRTSGSTSSGNQGSLNRAASADAAMVMGAGRAAGLIPQAGVEAFTKVRTTFQQPHTVKGPTTSVNTNVVKSLGASLTSLSPTARTPATNGPSSTMLPPKLAQGMLFPRGPKTMGTGNMNFSHFSRPAYMMRANLQHLGMSHGVAAHPRSRTPLTGSRARDANTSSGSSIAESTTTRQESGVSTKKDNDFRVEGSEGQQSLGTESSWPSIQNSSKDSEVAVNSVAARPETGRNSNVTDSAVHGAEKTPTQGPPVQEAPEPTITSSSRGSGNSADRGKEAASSGKRRPREAEESECQSEDVEDEMTELKKPQRGSTTKRSRAAEVHNMSERRRRDRINEKMKALQELIPNSNKTDKASMLDEAIEYLKMLQLQLQMMSMRSGMSIPSMVMPSGMQHLQISPMGHMPPMGMGMGPMVGMGMGMMDMGVVTPGRAAHMMPLPPQGGPSHSVSATSPAVSIVDSHDHRLPNNSVMESLNIYLARQQLQMSQQPINIDVYNAYIMHHQQQQQQQQHQHQLHHMPSNMGGGPPQ